jgi:hypothetical protein
MKNSFVYLFMAVFISFLVTGCGSDTVTNPPGNTTINVNGRVSDIFGSPASGISVIIGGQTKTSGADGSFTINNVTAPYDCEMLELGGNQKYGYLYKGLNTSSPRLTTASGISGVQYTSNIVVTFPAGLIPSGKKVMLFYSDTTNVIYGKINAGPVNNAVTYPVVWSNNNSTINGKICALVYSIDVSNNILSYDNYAEAELPVTSGLQSIWQPTIADFSLNPGEVNLTALINPPGGYSIVTSVLCINFSKLTNNPFLLVQAAPLISFTTTANISGLVPTGLPSNFTLNLFTRIAEPSGANGYKSTIVTAGINNQVNIEPASVLNTPLNGATGIDTTTVFNYSQATGSAIYAVKYQGSNNTYFVYTPGLNTTIPNFSPNLQIESNIIHNWNVTQYQGLNSVDEFVNSDFLHMVNLPGVLISADRTFTTAP